MDKKTNHLGGGLGNYLDWNNLSSSEVIIQPHLLSIKQVACVCVCVSVCVTANLSYLISLSDNLSD